MSKWLLSEERGSLSIPPLPEDMYDAVCVSIVDLGTQHWEWQGNPKFGQKLHIAWAIANETVDINGEAKPRIVSKEYTHSFGENANLRKDLEGWRGKKFAKGDKFELKNILGKSCRLLIGVNDKSNWPVVEAIKPKKFDVQVPTGVSLLFFDLDEWNGGELPSEIPAFVQKKIQASDQYKTRTTGAVQTAPISEATQSPVSDEDECPF
jgi:hypothetical protein